MLDAITAAQVAMLEDQARLQTINHNISNLQTPAYKRQVLDSRSFDEQLQINSINIHQSMQIESLQTQGTLIQTKNPKDLALVGDGYFQVQNENGLFYTRRGDFHINQQGELAIAKTGLLIGKNGPIHVEDQSFTIDQQGNIYIDDRKVDQINLVQFTHPESLEAVGAGLYQTTEIANPIDITTEVRQGFIEQSNVKSLDEMTEIIKTSNHFEAAQRIMRIADGLLSAAINQLGEGNV